MKPCGHLVVIGGGDRPLCVMQKIIELAGGSASRVVIIPTASETPEQVAQLQKLEFLALGAAAVDIVHCAPTAAQEDIKRVARATCVFFSGGDQRKLTAALLDTRLLDEIRALYVRGGVIAGTSAGAAVMSRVMITGDERPLSHRSASETPNGRHIETASGFGFIDRAIIDQHFVKRGRHYRLLNLLTQHPELVGIGIDEATAIVVAPDGTFSILGDSQVLIFDPAQQSAAQPVHVLSSGKRYCLNRQLVLN
jgi:cyanophycinase